MREVSTAHVVPRERFDYWCSQHDATDLSLVDRSVDLRDYDADALIALGRDGLQFGSSVSANTRARFGRDSADRFMLAVTLEGRMGLQHDGDGATILSSGSGVVMIDCRRSVVATTEGRHRQAYLTLPREVAVAAANGNPIPSDQAVIELATAVDVADDCDAAAAAQTIYEKLPLTERSAFIRLVATKIDALGDRLTQRAMRESGLPEGRLNGERARTVGQLRLFADEVKSGAWQRIRIDHADPNRTPPKPDLRLRMIPLGPVAVFGASNFPLAFSVAGGDTAAALATGCCVVVKGHPAHPGTSELVAGAIADAIEESGLPSGVFSLLNGSGNALGEALVKNPRIAAVAFTGSRAGGLALVDYAAGRDIPIPVYAEMSSVNPVVLMQHRLTADAEDLASAYVGSLSLGAGQFCTNPGIVLALESEALDRFCMTASQALSQVSAQTMLTDGIRSAYQSGVDSLERRPNVDRIGVGQRDASRCGEARIYSTTGDAFLDDPDLSAEIFGPSSIVVRCRDMRQLRSILQSLEGQLTATLQVAEEDHGEASALVPMLERLAGKIIVNGWPTGVEVSHATVHGGPYPATTDARSTSVGTLAIERFLRPVCYQDVPQELLPAGIWNDGRPVLRRVDGKFAW